MKMIVSAGSTFTNWIRVLVENKFSIDFKYIPKALFVTFVTLFFSPFILLEKIIYNKRINACQLKAPIFILGHMRSGTTFLHYLLCQDPNLTYITTSEAIFPGIFLTMRNVVYSIMKSSLPEKRPMDNIAIDRDSPQEEELGMANLCPYSPNNGSYFPRNYEQYVIKYALFEGVSEKIINNWKKTYVYFLKKIAFRSGGKRIVSKNLPNFGRIKQLVELFPDSKFIFIYRDPYKVFLSTKKLFKKFIFEHMIYHEISDQELEDVILRVAKRCFKEYFKRRNLIKKENLIEIKFEDFVKDPLNNLEKIYQDLDIEGFENAKEHAEKLCKGFENYKPDKYEIDPDLKKRIYKELKFFFDEYGYEA